VEGLLSTDKRLGYNGRPVQFEREVSRTVGIDYSDAETPNANLKGLRV
jgi:hypothetical protein